jgi:tetratricopeptide (TPR) repeat protein
MRKVLLAMLLCTSASAQEQLGTIVFANSGRPEAQPAFLRGVLLLHNFAYPQAKRAFVEAEKIDPGFVLAWWGEAMTYNHPIWNQVDISEGRRVLQSVKPLKQAATPRERGYIDALELLFGEGDKTARDYAYEHAMERVAKDNPDDAEAQVFWALSILGSRAWHQLDERRSMRAAAILEELMPTHAAHPGVLHYLIHAYDDPVHAPLGLRAARRYSKVASSAPHALHMPSHIFLQLGMWDDAARSNEAAFALSKEWHEPDLHSLSWLQYVYLQQHRTADAKQLLGQVDAKDDHARGVRETMQVRYAVETGEWSAFDFTGPVGLALRAIAETRFDDAERAIKDADSKKGEAHADVSEPEPDELRALLAAARGQMKEALHYAELAIKQEEKLGVPSGPPDDFKPANELYGELLMKAGRMQEASEQFHISLLRTPNRAASLAGAQRLSQ